MPEDVLILTAFPERRWLKLFGPAIRWTGTVIWIC